jgi:hypothetical protein
MAGRRGCLRGESRDYYHFTLRGVRFVLIVIPFFHCFGRLAVTGYVAIHVHIRFMDCKAFGVHSSNKLRRNAAGDEVAGTSVLPETGIEVSLPCTYTTKGERLGGDIQAPIPEAIWDA